MTDETLEERCSACDSTLVRTSADDEANPHDAPIVVCPGCLDVVRVER